jgi:hypothetical protein
MVPNPAQPNPREYTHRPSNTKRKEKQEASNEVAAAAAQYMLSVSANLREDNKQ